MPKGLRWSLGVLILTGGLLVFGVLAQPGATIRSSTGSVAEAADAFYAAPSIDSQPVPRDYPNDPPNVLVEAVVGQIHKLNPLLAAHNPVDRDITALIFEGLTTTNEFGEIVPDLAESWTISNEGLQYIFILRDDVLWQDGIPFTAEDVVFTIKMLSDPAFTGPESLHQFWRTVEVEALSENMVRFRLTQPLASFADQLRIGILPEHVLRGWPVDQLERHPFNLAPIGTGPYQLEALTSSEGRIDGVQLRVAPVYRLRPEGADGYAIDRIVFRTYPTAEAALDAFQRGEVNSVASIPPEHLPLVQQLPGLSLYTTIQPHIGVLIYNWERDAVRYVRNPRVRLALAHAIDRQGVVERYLAERAIPADSPILPDSWAYQPGLAWPAYGIDQAQAMLALSGVTFEEAASPTETSSADGESPEEETASESEAAAETEETPVEAEAPAALRDSLTILTLDDPALVGVAREIAAGWEQLGLRVTVEAVNAVVLRERLETGDFDAAMVEFSFEPSADPDPYVFWHEGQYGSGQNYGGMNDRRISEALEQARRDATGLHRVEYYRRFQALFAERVPALVLYYPLYTYAVDARLQGLQLGFLSVSSDRFRSIQDWRFSE